MHFLLYFVIPSPHSCRNIFIKIKAIIISTP
jgi:hypothetical protein